MHRPLPTSGTRPGAHEDQRRLGQGQGRRDRPGGRRGRRAGSRSSPTRSSIFVRGEGGWGGDRGPSTKVELPEREPDLDASLRVTPQQALLYRLCGDRNPLHADPAFAERPASRRRSCTACAPTASCCARSSTACSAAMPPVRGFTARFAGVVFPGETIRIRAWRQDDGSSSRRRSPPTRAARRRTRPRRLRADQGLTEHVGLRSRLAGGLAAVADRHPRRGL